MLWYYPFRKVFYLYIFSEGGGAGVKSQAYRMAMLYDFYGDVLTPRQKEFYDLYYNEDLSLGEIAENYNITRQGVRDVIVRAEAILTDLEDKTGLIKRFHTMKKQLEQVQQDAKHLCECAQRYDDEELDILSRRILDTTDTLLKE
jgi:predicted DNA-binding protein YlxM (UPF0122 family)